jgi:hypothetical protein
MWLTEFHEFHGTYTVRNYMTGALLYYNHMCQRGTGDTYQGTSKSMEGYGAEVAFGNAKEEGMKIAVHV